MTSYVHRADVVRLVKNTLPVVRLLILFNLVHFQKKKCRCDHAGTGAANKFGNLLIENKEFREGIS